MQTINLNAGKASFTIFGPDVVPSSTAYRLAAPARQRSYWPILAKWAKQAIIHQLEAGLGADGQPLPPPKEISRQWYRDTGREWRGPSMSPQFGQSRFQRHVRVMAFPPGQPDRVVGFWSHGTAKIAHYHATGTAGRGRPYFDDNGKIKGWRGFPGQVTKIVRNIVGLSKAWLAWAIARARAEWERTFGGAASTVQPAPVQPAPRPLPRPAAAQPSTAAQLRAKYPFLEQFKIRDVPAPVAKPRRGLLRRAFDALRRLGSAFFG